MLDTRIVKKSSSDTQIQFVFKDNSRQELKDFDGDKGSITVRYDTKQTKIFCGLGEPDVCTARTVRTAAANGMRKAVELKRKKVALTLSSLTCRDDKCLTAAMEGAILGAYTYNNYKSVKPSRPASLEVETTDITTTQARQIAVLCEGVYYCRDLVNGNASEIFPQRLEREARTLASGRKLAVEVLDEKAIRSKGLGLLWAVGQGSACPPRLIILSYKGAPRSNHSTAIIGKGITFDSGGYNLKPSGSIETMRQDMAGAAAVLGIMKTLVTLKPALNVIGVIPAAHNAVGSKSYFPGDVYRSYAGTTVEITNTDAEGRLVLADAFAYVKKHYAPSEIIDLATLTGSVVMALGETVAGLYANTDTIAQKLFTAGEITGERLWRLPLYAEFADSTKSDIADLRNTSKWKRGVAGSITGAAFLSLFAGTTPWAHLDIAGTAFNEGEPRGELPKFGTGFGVRLLWNYLLGT